METIETESFLQSRADYYEKIENDIYRKRGANASFIPRNISLDDTVGLYCAIFNALSTEKTVSPKSLVKKLKRKHLISVIKELPIDNEMKEQFGNFISQTVAQSNMKAVLFPLLEDYFKQQRLAKIYEESPELVGEKFVQIECEDNSKKGKSKSKNAGQNNYHVCYVFESCVYRCSYIGDDVQKTKNCGWKLTDDDIKDIVTYLEARKQKLFLPFVTTFDVVQEPASMRFVIRPSLASESLVTVKDAGYGFIYELLGHSCPQLTPQCLTWKYYCESQMDTASIADRLMYIAGAGDSFGNKLVGCFKLNDNFKPVTEMVKEATEEFTGKLQQLTLQGISPQLQSFASKVIAKPDIKFYRDITGLNKKALMNRFSDGYADLKKGKIDLKYYSEENAIGFDVGGEIGFDLINCKFFLDPDMWRKLKRIDTQVKIVPEIDKAISFAKTTASAKGIDFDKVATLSFKKTLFRIVIDDGILPKSKLGLNYKDSDSWTKAIAAFLNEYSQRVEKKRNSLQKKVNGSGLVGNILATATADLVLVNKNKDGNYHLTANNCVAILRDMSTVKNFYFDIAHTRFDKLFRLIPNDEVEHVVSQVINKGLVEESYHRISDYNVVYYSLVPSDCTKYFVSCSVESTDLSTDFGLLHRLEKLPQSLDETDTEMEIDDKVFIQLLQSLVKHPAVWCYKPDMCRDLLRMKPEIAKKLLKVYSTLEDDSFKKKYLKLLIKETENDEAK